MALIKCKECGKDISENAAMCPHCGHEQEKTVSCSECGTENEEQATICKNCGNPLKEGK